MPESAVVPVELDRERLDRAIPVLFPGISRRFARVLIGRGAVYLAGQRCMVSSRGIKAGSRIEIVSGPAPSSLEFETTRLIWRMEGMVAVDKPGLIPLCPTKSAVEGCFLFSLAAHLGLSLRSLHPINRLDTPTSGIALVALSASAAAYLSELIRQGGIKKTYLAWVQGKPPDDSGRWDFPLQKVAEGYMKVSPGGSPASTLYKVRESKVENTLLELVLLTGRTHQIRVHCAEAGCPVLGDRKYGGHNPGIGRALLHSWRIEFPLPDGGPVVLDAPIPPDMSL